MRKMREGSAEVSRLTIEDSTLLDCQSQQLLAWQTVVIVNYRYLSL